MSRRHTAAILLVGWYLLIPPPLTPRYQGEHETDIQAPLSQWENLGQFDDASQCERERTNLGNQLSNRKIMQAEEQQLQHWYGDYARKRLAYSKCLEADDPRLAAPE